MKRLILSACIFFSLFSKAQELNMTFSSGYNHKFAAAQLTNYFQNLWVGAFYPYTLDYTTYSLGKGVNTNFGINYTTNYSIGFQLDASFLYGIKEKVSVEYFKGTNDYFSKEIYSRFYRFLPQVYYENILSEKWKIKFHFGALINWGEFRFAQATNYEGNPGFSYKNKFYGGTSFGAISGISSTYKLNNWFSIFLDLNLINSSYSPAKRKTTEVLSGDENVTENFPPSYLESEYFDAYEKPAQYDPNKPLREIKIKLPNSSIGLQFGISFKLWGKDSPKVDDETIEKP